MVYTHLARLYTSRALLRAGSWSVPAANRAAALSTAASDGARPSILVEERLNHAVIRLNRPSALNALSSQVCRELLSAAKRLDRQQGVAAIIITGSGRAFAAGADIKELESLTQEQARQVRPVEQLDGLAEISTPLIAAVNGYALGGGCELAMMCDVIIAGAKAVFGLPELQLGVMPAMGGTQRLPRLVGRALAMDMILTGRRLTAQEALAAGLVSRVVPDALTEATAIAERIATSASGPSAVHAKAAVRGADVLPLQEGLVRERQLFYSLFGPDQKEGMGAFMAKRPAQFKEPKPMKV